MSYHFPAKTPGTVADGVIDATTSKVYDDEIVGTDADAVIVADAFLRIPAATTTAALGVMTAATPDSLR